jgi:hypothetical protein
MRHKKLKQLLAGLIRNHMRPVLDALGVVPQVQVHVERYVVAEDGGGEERDQAGEHRGPRRRQDVLDRCDGCRPGE